MQELKKILEEIKREKLKHWDSSERLETDKLIGWCFDKCTDIIRKHLNDGWILVDERLPTMEEYQKDDGRAILDDGNRRYAGYFDVYTGKFYRYRHITAYRAELYEDNGVIAWRPLPEPYRPERRNNHDGE